MNLNYSNSSCYYCCYSSHRLEPISLDLYHAVSDSIVPCLLYSIGLSCSSFSWWSSFLASFWSAPLHVPIDSRLGVNYHACSYLSVRIPFLICKEVLERTLDRKVHRPEFQNEPFSCLFTHLARLQFVDQAHTSPWLWSFLQPRSSWSYSSNLKAWQSRVCVLDLLLLQWSQDQYLELDQLFLSPPIWLTQSALKLDFLELWVDGRWCGR